MKIQDPNQLWQPSQKNGPSRMETPAELETILSTFRIAMGLISAAIIIAALYFGREIFIPLALALLLGFVLDPLVSYLRRRKVPRVYAVIFVVSVTLVGIGVAGIFLGNQVRLLSAQLPTFEGNIQTKVRAFRAKLDAPGAFDGAFKTYDLLQKEMSSPESGGNTSTPKGQRPPEQVQLVEKPNSPIQQSFAWLEASAGPLANAGIILVFLLLVLIDRQDLRDRLLRLLGGQLHRMTDAMNDAGTRISKYLTMQLLVNATYAIPMAAGLWLIGVPGAILWGSVAAVMRFIPYVGPMIAAIFPLALAFAVDPGWSMLLWTLGLIVVLELISNNVIEPMLYGASTGLSAISLMVSATFWTVLWGPVGLVMSTPLTVCLLVIGRHIPHMKFLDVLLGSQPPLDAPTRLYQRLLASDVEEAVEIAEGLIKASHPGGFYHQVGTTILNRASGDYHNISRAEHRHRFISGMDRLLNELEDLHPKPEGLGRPQAIFIGGKWELDTFAARMLAHGLNLSGVSADYCSSVSCGEDPVANLDLLGASTVCLALFTPEPQTQIRYLCRRLRQRWPDLHIILALWNAPPALLDEATLKSLGADEVATSYEEALIRTSKHLGAQISEDYLPAPIPERDIERVRALRASGLFDVKMKLKFDLLAKRTADIFDMPISLVTLIDDVSQTVCGSGGLLTNPSEPSSSSAQASDFNMPRSLSMCGHVVASAQTMMVADIARDPRFNNNPLLTAAGLRFYAGAPLRDPAGYVYGALCVLDKKPRSLNGRELRLLEMMAQELMDSLQLHKMNALSPVDQPQETAVKELNLATLGQLVPT